MVVMTNGKTISYSKIYCPGSLRFFDVHSLRAPHRTSWLCTFWNITRMRAENITFHVIDMAVNLFEHAFRFCVSYHQVAARDMCLVLGDKPRNSVPTAARASSRESLQTAFSSNILITERHELTLGTKHDAIKFPFSGRARLFSSAPLRLCERVLTFRHSLPCTLYFFNISSCCTSLSCGCHAGDYILTYAREHGMKGAYLKEAPQKTRRDFGCGHQA